MLGVYFITRRKPFAASTAREQNRIWGTNYGPRVVKHNERVAVVLGIFAIVNALSIWSHWGWP